VPIVQCVHSDLFRRIAVLALLVATAGCRMAIEAPEEFLQMSSNARELRLTTAGEARLWVREFTDPDRGDLDFWAKALQNDLVERRGYRLVETGTLTDARGSEGIATRYETTLGGETCGYLTAIWVDAGGGEHTIRTAEFVAPLDEFEARLESVRTALATLKP
jgi:hypothetical protein